jgi:hypothetical protein
MKNFLSVFVLQNGWRLAKSVRDIDLIQESGGAESGAVRRYDRTHQRAQTEAHFAVTAAAALLEQNSGHTGVIQHFSRVS